MRRAASFIEKGHFVEGEAPLLYSLPIFGSGVREVNDAP